MEKKIFKTKEDRDKFNSKSSRKIIKKSPKKSPKKELPCIENAKIVPLKHQKKVIDFFNKDTKKGIIVAHSMGKGKTITSVLISKCFLDRNRYNKVILIAPKSLISNFTDTIEKLYDSKILKKYNTYTFSKFHNTFKDYTEKELEKFFKKTLIIIDEAHNLRSSKSNRSNTVIKSSKYANKILLLSGTSVYNEPKDIVTLITMLNGEDLKKNKKTFNKLVSENGEISIDDNSKEYFGCLLSIYNVDENSDDFPEVYENYVDVEMNGDLYYEYKLIESEIKSEYEELTAKGSKDFYTGLRKMIAKMPAENNPKYQYILNKLLSLKNKNKLYKSIIYSGFKDLGIRGALKLIRESGFIAEELTGELSIEERKNIVKKYNNDEIDVLLITKAGGEGLDLKGTRNVFLIEPSWNKSNENQVITRAVRYKSHSHLPKEERYVKIYHLIFTKPPKTRAKNIIKKKINELTKKGIILDEDLKDYLLGDDVYPTSIDMILLNLIEKKNKITTTFLDNLSTYSIENYDC